MFIQDFLSRLKEVRKTIKNIDELWNTFIKKQDTVFKITTKENIVFIATVYTWFEVDNDAPEANSDSLDFYQNVCFLVKKVLSSNLIDSVIKEGAYITYSQFDFPSKIEVYKQSSLVIYISMIGDFLIRI